MKGIFKLFPLLCSLIAGGAFAQAIGDTEALTYEQKEIIGKMKNDIKAESELSEACRLVGEGKDDEAMNILGRIEWWSTSVKVSKLGVNKEDNERIIVFFKRYSILDRKTCNLHAAELFNDSLQ